MYQPHFTITPTITKHLEAIGSVFGYLMAVELPKSYKKELVKGITAETIHASTAIEGNTLTEKQVGEVLSGKKITAEKEDIQEIVNYNKALEYIQTLIKEKDVIITETLIRQINAIILKGIRDDGGKYREKQVYVGDYLPPEHFKVASLMEEFVAWLKNPQPPSLSPILYTGIAHYQFVAIHPFGDGNGRTTRVLTTLILVQNGYDMTKYFALESYYNRKRNAYYDALSSADRYRVKGHADLTRWLEYYAEGMLIEAERAKSCIEELLEKNRIKGKIWLSDTQVKILKTTVKKEVAKTADYIKASGLSRKGTYNAVERLVRLGLLKRTGEKKGTYYTITEKGLSNVR